MISKRLSSHLKTDLLEHTCSDDGDLFEKHLLDYEKFS